MKWEYKIIYIDARRWTSTGLPENLGTRFDAYGKEGWELVKVEPKINRGFMTFGYGTDGYVAFFKRPLA